MKVTQFGPGSFPLALAGWSTGDFSVNSNFNTTDGGLSATNFVQAITANGSNMLLRPIANFAAGSNIYLTLDQGPFPAQAYPSNTIRIHSTASAGGNIITANGSNSLAAVVNLVAGSGIALGVSGQDITITNTGTGSGGGASGAFYVPPAYTNEAGTFTGSGTSTVVTMTAPTSGDNLVAIVASTGRGCNSVTQTNVTWTQRYTASGNSQFIEIWTGVVSASAGTTATFAFTGTNHQQCETFVLNGPTNFTAATAANTATAATTALSTVGAGAIVAGNYYLHVVSANQPSSGYSGHNQPTNGLQAFGGQLRSYVFRANLDTIWAWSLSSSAVSYFTALIKLS